MDIQEKKRAKTEIKKFKVSRSLFINVFGSALLIALVLIVTSPIRSCCRYSDEYDEYFDKRFSLGELREFNPLCKPGKRETPDSLIYVKDSSSIVINLSHQNIHGHIIEDTVSFPIERVKWFDRGDRKAIFIAENISMSSEAWKARNVHIEDTLQGIDLFRKIVAGDHMAPNRHPCDYYLQWGETKCPKCGGATNQMEYSIYIYCPKKDFSKYVRRIKRK